MNYINFNCNNFVRSSSYSCCYNDILRHRKYCFIRDKSNSNRNIKLKHIDITSSNLDTIINSSYSSTMKNGSLDKSSPTSSTLSCTMSASFPHHNIFVITVPPKVWRPKAPTKYVPLPPHPNNQREDYLHTPYGYPIKRVPSLPSALHDDIIT